MRRAALRWMLGAALATVTLPACKGDEALIAKGRKAAAQGNYEAAHEAFDQILASSADDYNALWGKADVYERQANLGEQQKLLERIMAKKELAEAYAGVVKPALEKNYRKQAEALADVDDVKAEDFLRKAIDLDKKSEAHLTLGNLLMRRGDKALKAADYEGASKAYEAAAALRIPRKLRGQLAGKKEIADFWAYKKAFMPRFEAVHKELVDAGMFDDKDKSFVVTAQATIEGDPKDDPNFEANAERMGLVAVTAALNDLSWKVAGKERPEGASVAYDRSVVEVVGKKLEKVKKEHIFTFQVKLPMDAVVEKVQLIDAGKFEITKPGEQPAGEQPAGEQPAGEQPAGEQPAEEKPAE